MSFFKELKRRNVFKVGIAYAVTTWVLLQLADTLTEILSLPDWAPKLILLMLVVGFIPALIIAWAFELTPDGIKLEKAVNRTESITPKTGRKLNYIIIVSLGLSLGYFIWESRFEQKTAEYESSTTMLEDEEPVVTGELEEVTPPGFLAPLTDVDKNSIAVLPFANRSADVEDIYFTDGIHEDLLTQLSKIDAFSVISRSSVMEYRNTTKNLRQIARELSVANVMEGSVQRAGDRVRINVQLIDAETDEHLWAEIYDRELTTSNLFDIQSEIAQAIAGELKTTLSDSELASVADVPTDNVEAYDLYLQARQFAQNETMKGHEAAIKLFMDSLDLDPDFKHAWIGLARAYISIYFLWGGESADRDQALAAIEKARAIDSSFAELYMAEGFYWYWGHLDYERALYNLEKAIEMMPGNDEALMWRGWVSRRAGLWDKALLSMQSALKLNPRVALHWSEYALTAMYLHQYEEAERAASKSLELDPDNFWGKSTMAEIVIHSRGDLKTAANLLVGAQHSDSVEFFDPYMLTQILSKNYEQALVAARNLPAHLELQRSDLRIKEVLAAQVLFYMGRHNEAKQAANAALFRLKGLRTQWGEDYRIDVTEAQVAAILGAEPREINDLVKKSLASTPNDELAVFQFRRNYAHIFGISGMAPEAIEMIESILVPPSDTSVYTIDLHPAFDSIRETPEFVAMMEKYR